MKVRVSWFALMFSVLAACGGDEPTTPGAVGAAGGGGTPAGTAGTTAAGSGGLSATAGSGVAGTTQTTAGTGAGAAGASAAPVTCGTATCLPAPPNPGLSKVAPVACCANAATNECGNSIAPGTCTPPPPVAPKCMFSFSTARTCCVVATNTCGIDASAYGMGCLDVSASVGGLKMTCDGSGAAGSGAAAGAGGAAAGASGAAAGAGGAAAGAGGAAAGAGGARAGAGGA